MDKAKSRRIALWTGIALLGFLVGGAGGSAFTILSMKLKKQDAGPRTVKCETAPELGEALVTLQSRSLSTEEEVTNMRVELADLGQRIDEIKLNLPDDAYIRTTLPPPFIKEVENFFRSANAKNLLSRKALGKGTVEFGDPRFVDVQTITVPYTVGDHEHYLLVGIKILEFYHLQFDVLWDSMEGN